MTTSQQIRDSRGSQVIGEQGVKLGKITEIYQDEQSGRPEFMSVKPGMLTSGSEALVPVESASVDEEAVHVPYSRETVQNAPEADGEGRITPEQEQELARHYSLNSTYGMATTSSDGGQSTTSSDGGESATSTSGQQGTAPGSAGETASTGTSQDAMTRSEEQMHVGTTRRETGRARLRKYVETEQQQQTVPVSHEEVRVEREPITEADREQARSGAELTEDDTEVVLHEQQPTVEKETVPKERVRLETEEVTGEQTVSGEVQKERVEVEEDDQHGKHTGET